MIGGGFIAAKAETIAYHPLMNTHNESPERQPPNKSRAGATMSNGAKVLEAEDAKRFAIRAAQSLGDDKCTDVVVIDVTGLSPVTGFIVIGSGTSARQMHSALESLDEVAKDCGTSTFQISTDDDAIWLLADFVDVVVHLFEPNARAHYDLEGLWFEGERLVVPPSERSKTRPGLGAGDTA